MSWAGKQHPVETAIEWLAPIPLALAVTWSGGLLGLSFMESVAIGVAVLTAGFAVIRLAGGAGAVQLRSFEPAGFASVELDELLLEEKDAVLELNDRLDEIRPDSRVVRLFERQDPTPGELVDRIVDFLADGGRQAIAGQPAAEPRHLPDASEALHSALANIRASLR